MSRSVNDEIRYTVGEDEGRENGKNYFCINPSGDHPTKILKNIIRKYNDNEAEKRGIDERIPGLLQAFSDKSTYIAKADCGSCSHIGKAVRNIRTSFNVIAEALPLDGNESQAALEQKLQLAKTFLIDGDGVLRGYTGASKKVVIPPSVVQLANGAFGGCQTVKNCVIPSGVEMIGDDSMLSRSKKKRIHM